MNGVHTGIYIRGTGGIYVTSGTMTLSLPMHNIYYKAYTNTDLLQTLEVFGTVHLLLGYE
jgi:hypothetical protein